MLEVFIKSIPKTTNEIVFALGLIGLFFVFYRYKRFPYIYLAVCVIMAMMAWRTVYQIDSGRYAAALIYPFSFFSAFFLSSIMRYKKKRAFSLFVIIVAGIVFNCIYKCYNISEANIYLKSLAELHHRLNDQKTNCKLAIHVDDAARIKQIEKKGAMIEPYDSNNPIQDMCSYIERYRSVDHNTLYCVMDKPKENSPIVYKSVMSKHKLLLSFFVHGNKKKKMLAYNVESANSFFLTLSQNKIIQPESGILQNGDMEELDSPEKSYKKLKTHIGNYSLYFDFDESKRTPLNAYFHNDPNYTKYLPYYSCLNPKALSGKNSAKIFSHKGIGYLLFYQKFYSGTYEYSLVFSGKKNTKICIVNDLYKNQRWNVNSLATCSIPSKGIFQIKSSFSVSDLEAGEYFLVGAWVQGEAYLDNFCLRRTNE